MSINFKRLFIIFMMFLFTMTIISCKKDDNKNKGYDGRIFDISLNQDGKVQAKTIQVGTNYELIISGSGQAKSYDKKELVPWNAISKKITNVKIEEGIENIGNYYFYSCTLDSYFIPSSVTEVEENSFNSSATIYSYSAEVISSNSKKENSPSALTLGHAKRIDTQKIAVNLCNKQLFCLFFNILPSFNFCYISDSVNERVA